MNENLPFEYKELPLESVEEDEEAQIRVLYDVSDLVESIREVGQLMPGYAYKDGDKYKVFVGIRRLRAVKELYEKEEKPKVFKAFVFEKKPKNFYELIREENVKRSDLTGLDKIYIILKFSFADKILPVRDVQFIKPVIRSLSESVENDLKELAEEEQRAKAQGFNNHLSLEELIFLFRDLQSLEERKFFAIFFLVYRINVKRVTAESFKEFAIKNVSILKPRDLEIAGLSKEDIEKIIAIYQALPYQAEIIKEEFEEKEEEPEEKLEKTEETLLPESAEEQPLEIEKPEEQPEEVEKLEREEMSFETKEEVPPEISEEETIILMQHDVEYEIINGKKYMFVKKVSGIQPIIVEDEEELQLEGKKVRIKFV
jgi:ParB-like nuclease domain.